MTASIDCPGIECWQALFANRMSPEQRESCERHLEWCMDCQERLHCAEACSEKMRHLGQKFGDPTRAPTDPTLSQFLERLREGKVLERTVPVEPADLYFLRGTDRPGILGILGEYEVREVIGQGGMGIVLKAYEPALHRLVAIKVMSPTVAGSANARKRFTREVRAAAAVCHEHLIAVHGVYEEAGLPYLVMQYIEGESLQARLDRSGPLQVNEVVRIGLQTALGLAAAHAQGLIHRDVKPANLLLSSSRDAPDGTDETNGTDMSHRSHPSHPSCQVAVKITDFGLARMVDDVALTQHGVVAGTPEYMAPEQARGETVDHRADLFSLGSVLYALCTGQPPFSASSVVAVLGKVADEEPAPIRELNADVPVWLEALVARLMAKDPANRLQSAAEVAALLEGRLAHSRRRAFPFRFLLSAGLFVTVVATVALMIISWIFPAKQKTVEPISNPISYLNQPIGTRPVPGIEEKGFHDPEITKLGVPVRWTNGAAKLVVPLHGPPPKALLVYLAIPLPRPSVRIRVNGQSVFAGQVSQDNWKQTFNLSSMNLGTALTVEILSDTFVPAKKGTGSGDRRTLGVRVLAVTLLGDTPKN